MDRRFFVLLSSLLLLFVLSGCPNESLSGTQSNDASEDQMSVLDVADLTASVGDRTVTLTWSEPSNDTDLSQYKVTWTPSIPGMEESVDFVNIGSPAYVSTAVSEFRFGGADVFLDRFHAVSPR
jgi:ABC-type Fe3+-hydroxamate transport system substrate-binding protein